MTWRLRSARLDDAEAMAKIHASVANPSWSAHEIAGWLARSDAFAIVTEEIAGSPAAFALALKGGEDADILMIATASQMHRTGAGRATLRALIQEAGQRRVGRLVLEAARNNLPALGLYRGEGFVEIAVRTGYYRQASGRVDALVLARLVSPDSGHELA